MPSAYLKVILILTQHAGSQSPTRAATPGTPYTAPGSGPVTAEEIVAVLTVHPQGMTIGQLHNAFRGRVGDNRQGFINLVKVNAKWGADKLLRPKNA